MLTNHPNAEISVYTGAFSVLLIYLVGFAGIQPPPEVAVALTTVLTGIVLVLGKRSRKNANA